ncbi:MAG: PEGA domain-containing protein [Deltaproteobacteria bacterium]|nr:PEGA domain-containing protein [Deltaproteobacteria bacterium]
MTRDPFLPPEGPPAPPPEVQPRPEPGGTLATEDVRKRHRRAATKYRRPMNTPLIIWFFAFVGAGCLFLLFTKGIKGLMNLRLDREAARAFERATAKPTQWRGVQQGESVLIDMELSPRDARVFVDGQPANSNPVMLPKANQTHDIVVVAPGFVERAVKVTANKPAKISVKLEKQAP